MNAIRKLLERMRGHAPDRVLLVVGGTNLRHVIADVEWFCGRAYASPYTDTWAELLHGGKCSGGACYLKEWKPASERMHQHFNDETGIKLDAVAVESTVTISCLPAPEDFGGRVIGRIDYRGVGNFDVTARFKSQTDAHNFLSSRTCESE